MKHGAVIDLLRAAGSAGITDAELERVVGLARVAPTISDLRRTHTIVTLRNPTRYQLVEQQQAGMEDERAELRLTCVECRHEHPVQSTSTLDDRYRFARCPMCKRQTPHVR